MAGVRKIYHPLPPAPASGLLLHRSAPAPRPAFSRAPRRQLSHGGAAFGHDPTPHGAARNQGRAGAPARRAAESPLVTSCAGTRPQEQRVKRLTRLTAETQRAPRERGG